MTKLNRSSATHSDPAAQIARMLAGALAYAKSDKSDPFAYSRAVSHINNGIATCKPISVSDDKNAEIRVDAFYSAEETREERSVQIGNTIEKFTVAGWKNICRP